MAKHPVITTDVEIERLLEQLQTEPEQPHAVFLAVDVKSPNPTLAIEMNDGSRHSFPIEHVQGLADLSAEELSRLKLSDTGDEIVFDEKDLQIYIPGLLNGVFGTRAWMSHLGRLGGRARSAAKCDAARRNGALGGRPKKTASSEPFGDICAAAQVVHRWSVESSPISPHPPEAFARLFAMISEIGMTSLPRLT